MRYTPTKNNVYAIICILGFLFALNYFVSATDDRFFALQKVILTDESVVAQVGDARDVSAIQKSYVSASDVSPAYNEYRLQITGGTRDARFVVRSKVVAGVDYYAIVKINEYNIIKPVWVPYRRLDQETNK